ncbi:N-acetylmuramate alpha-1-phosphate uridylyltransferase MurU [Thioalkalicoccus limnaeus]|uniref:N-acetylmuramate alpha-1-phosphate uridylyltransferase MurU n=1 Tax=Thioalkalicoccus limnaeus TaxID=120681 RepID=A0ABV4BE85_9GAMM
MKAMILAAGRGERMRPLTDKTPKPLLKAGGKSLIEHRIERLAAAGFEDLVINHAHLGAQIAAALGNGRRWGIRIRYSPEEQALETGGGIFRALRWLGPGPFVVVNADIWTDFDFRRLRRAPAGLAHLVLVPNPSQHPQGDFALSAGRVRYDGTPRYTFSGIGLYRPELFAGCRPGAFPLAPLLRAAMDRGQVEGELHAGRWFDIGTPERLHALDRMLRISDDDAPLERHSDSTPSTP